MLLRDRAVDEVLVASRLSTGVESCLTTGEVSCFEIGGRSCLITGRGSGFGIGGGSCLVTGVLITGSFGVGGRYFGDSFGSGGEGLAVGGVTDVTGGFGFGGGGG